MKVNLGRLAVAALLASLAGLLAPSLTIAIVLCAGIGIASHAYWPWLEPSDDIKAGGTD